MATLERAAQEAGLPATVVGDPVLSDTVFASGPMDDYRDTLRANAELHKAFNASLRTNGILNAPMKFYASLAHSETDIEFAELTIGKAVAVGAAL